MNSCLLVYYSSESMVAFNQWLVEYGSEHLLQSSLVLFLGKMKSRTYYIICSMDVLLLEFYMERTIQYSKMACV